MAHLGADSLTLLTELARCQIALHEESRAMADPRSEEAANAAAAAERATQAVLRRALALDDSTTEWRALAHEALKVLLDVSRERECRETGLYDEPTPAFRSVMAERSVSDAAVVPTVSALMTVQARTVPAAVASTASSIAVPTKPAATAPAETKTAAPLQAPTIPPSAQADAPTATAEAPAPTSGTSTSVVAGDDEETAFRFKLRPPLLENINLRDLSPETREVLRAKPRGITLLEGIRLMKELKIAGYGDDFSVEQTGDEEAGKKWKSGSGSKANVAEKFWVEFVEDVPFEDVNRDDIRDALKILPQQPFQHSKGKKFVAEFGFKALVEDLEAEE
ncbi:hypothetical protein Q4543_14220 [Salipiger sp. 1_MG-2023]|uniref:hypothetical protein n=1 Tax=Salipiger sp. 1_MG-2023 TaxID=3062665 RepID=UPI0026E208D7|nr:hypothetical protein [Salipiger sp. 1_MG-2023]MDO6586669.1 hypothetical protein [Salipiger sp. 1_MG-2023]